MSFLHSLAQFTGNVGRGAEDLFTLGGAELARKFGGQGAKRVLNPMATGLGANFEAGAAGGSAMMGGQSLGMFGGGSGGLSAMTPYMPTSTPVMGQMGSTLGAGMGSSLNLAPAYGSTMGASAGAPVAAGAGPSALSKALNYYRMMPKGGGQQQQQAPQQNQGNSLQHLYAMFPNLRPGATFNHDEGMNYGY